MTASKLRGMVFSHGFRIKFGNPPRLEKLREDAFLPDDTLFLLKKYRKLFMPLPPPEPLTAEERAHCAAARKWLEGTFGPVRLTGFAQPGGKRSRI